MLVVVFALSMFLSAGLLFVVEPMVAKMMLPLLGGTPAVWNTCLVFFQTILLAGYAYAYASLKWFSRKVQIAQHVVLGLLALAFVFLRPVHIGFSWQPPVDTNPVLWIFAVLAITVGLPFFFLASNTPVMQRWFAHSNHRDANDPYFLYASSNAGSLVGLLSYPLVLEPFFRLSRQSVLWGYGFLVFFALTVICAMLVWNGSQSCSKPDPVPLDTRPATHSWRERLLWMALAFVPSSLMLGVTTELTTDVPAIPLFWVLPLALYLISFVLVFARRQRIPHEWMIRREPFLILAALIPTISQTKFPLPMLLLMYLSVLFAVAMVCHGELARSRPDVSRLTEFYLLMSVGGVLGGIFNSLVAPIAFRSVLEFPLVLILAALLRPAVDEKRLTGRAAVWARRKDWLLPLALGICMAVVFLGISRAGIKPNRALNVLIFGYSLLWCLSFGKRPLRFGVGVTVVLIASSFYVGTFGHVLETRRSFFGVMRVSDDPEGKFRRLFHGGTIHGMQSLDPARKWELLTYYEPVGPAGDIFQTSEARRSTSNWAVIGLGAGSLSCYTQPGQNLTYYEIDPLVAEIAQDPRWFTLLQHCAPQRKIILGDARLELRSAPDAHYDVIVLDAFSGDSIPMHLLTREALALYLRKLAPHGILVFHISNLYLNLAPTLGALAKDAQLAGVIDVDGAVSQAEIDRGRFPSIWVVMARDSEELSSFRAGQTGSKWVPLPGGSKRVWTDDFSNLLTAIRW